MREKLRPALRILDFFVPMEVLSSVLLVFVPENVLALAVGNIGLVGWIAIYLPGLTTVSTVQYLSADTDELEDLHDDVDDI